MTATPDTAPQPSGDCELTSYAEIVEVITNLRFLVREKRRRERLSMRAAAEQIGVGNASTIHRFEHGNDVSTENLVAMIRWLDRGAS
ncbi:hypothetical protein EV383_4413 [Pseudonocardia sediminis]|uniref:Helix-turn-helix protein n=1 Tax=Pseudonocardia sediminis TaxID=1397368 RepID=A0A4Q7V206_PSEST|nr:helix-turn-helix transcriptional regulator [Pseudonocardia sediminis]RZT87488.1 hypothetical protein EV383_4413 [Pseudonocardia sediminis]